jgi:hypothetical protein
MTIVLGILLFILGFVLATFGRAFVELFAGLGFFFLFRTGAAFFSGSDSLKLIVALAAGVGAGVLYFLVTRSRPALFTIAGCILTAEMIRFISYTLLITISSIHTLAIPQFVPMQSAFTTIILSASIGGCLIGLALIWKKKIAGALPIIAPAFGGMLVGQVLTKYIVSSWVTGPYTIHQGWSGGAVVGFGVGHSLSRLEETVLLTLIWGFVALSGSMRQRKQWREEIYRGTAQR